MTPPEQTYLNAAEAVRSARLRYAEEFLLRKGRHATTDGQAHQQTIIETKDELTILTAQLELARRALDRS